MGGGANCGMLGGLFFFFLHSLMGKKKIVRATAPPSHYVAPPLPILQQHYDLWGPNAHKFNPKRFAHEIVGACKTPQAYMPFRVGSCVCAGQHFAMTELKVILSLILSKFFFSLSPVLGNLDLD